MRDATHMAHVERWALHIRENPDWKKIHTSFVNAQFATHRAVLKRLLAQDGGAEKVLALYRITNVNGYATLLAGKQAGTRAENT